MAFGWLCKKPNPKRVHHDRCRDSIGPTAAVRGRDNDSDRSDVRRPVFNGVAPLGPCTMESIVRNQHLSSLRRHHVSPPTSASTDGAPKPATEFRWDAFVSYAQALDAPLAKALRDGLQSMGKSPFALRRARVFLDTSSLAFTPDLPKSLQTALQSSRSLIVLCSPEAARSPWVALEIQAWLERHPVENLILVLAAGRLAWGDGGFDRERSDALPEPLFGVFQSEPLWLDMTWARDAASAHAEPAMRTGVARLAAAILKLPLDEIEGDDVRSHRTLKRLRTLAVVALAILTACSIAFGIIADLNRRTAEQQRQIAMQRALASTAQAGVAGAPSLSNAQASAAHVLAMQPSARGRESWEAAFTSLEALPTAILRSDTGITAGRFVPGSHEFVVGTARNVSRHDPLGRQLWTTSVTHEVDDLAWAPEGDWLVAVGSSRVVTALASDGAIVKSFRWRHESALGEPVRIKGARVIDGEHALIFATEGLVLVERAKGVATLHPMSIDRLAACDGAVAWSQADGKVMAMPLSRGLEYRLVHQHAGGVTYLACAANGGSVVSVDEHDEAVWTRGDQSSSTHLHGVRALVLAPAGDRLAVNNSQVLQTGLLDLSRGSNETLLFGGDFDEVLWRAPRNVLSTVLAFQGDWLLVADDQSRLVRVEARSIEEERARRVDEIPINAQFDHVIGLAIPGQVMVITKDGRVDEYDFEAHSRRPWGRTTGWAIAVDLSDDRRALLVHAQTEVADLTDDRKAAILFSPESAPGPMFFDRAKDVAMRGTSGEIAVLVRNVETGFRLAWSTPLAGPTRPSVPLGGLFESISLSADGANVLAHGGDGTILTDVAGGVLWHHPSIESIPRFIGGSKALLLFSEGPEILPEGTTEPVRLPYESGNVGTNRVTADLRFGYVTVDDQHELWDLNSAQRVYAAPANETWSAALSEDETLLVTAIESGGLDVLTLADDLNVRHIDVPLSIEGEFAFIGSRELLVPGLEGVARIDLLTGSVTMVDAPGKANGIAAAADGGRFVLSYADHVVRLHGESNQLVNELRISGTLADTEFSPDGQWIALGSHDGGVRLLDRSGQVVADIRAGTGLVADVAFVNDEWLLIEGQTKAALVPIDPYAGLCSRAIRALSPEEWKAVGGTGSSPHPCQP